MANEKRYRFLKKTVPREGKIAVSLAGISALLMVLGAFISFLQGGNAGAPVGALGLMALALSGYGFHVGLNALQKSAGTSSRITIMGTLAAGVVTVIWLGNNGSPQDAKGTIRAKDTGVKYQVAITWVDGKGWKPTKVEQLK